jgi:hypothetical protein
MLLNLIIAAGIVAAVTLSIIWSLTPGSPTKTWKTFADFLAKWLEHAL